MLDWLIVGGGMHGTYLSNYLVKVAGVDKSKLLVVDPHPEPLAVWNRCTQNTCMEFLRSPAEHNLDTGHPALRKFGQGWPSGSSYRDSYDRPSLALFNAHCDSIIKAGALAELRLQAKATGLIRRQDSYVVDTEYGGIAARQVILAMGCTEQLSYPQWAMKLSDGVPLVHIFSRTFQKIAQRPWTRVVVVGAGISGAQLAIALAKRGQGEVTLVHTGEITKRRFDADPCWLADGCQSILRRKKNHSDRRHIVDSARHTGTIPDDVHQQLYSSLRSGILKSRQSKIVDAVCSNDEIRLYFEDGAWLDSDLVILATGFAKCSAESKIVRSASEVLGLKRTLCGSPIVDEQLRWHDNLYVTGSLAELVVGPAARNIVGARLSSERIGRAILRKRHHPKEFDYFYFKKKA